MVTVSLSISNVPPPWICSVADLSQRMGFPYQPIVRDSLVITFCLCLFLRSNHLPYHQDGLPVQRRGSRRLRGITRISQFPCLSWDLCPCFCDPYSRNCECYANPTRLCLTVFPSFLFFSRRDVYFLHTS